MMMDVDDSPDTNVKNRKYVMLFIVTLSLFNLLTIEGHHRRRHQSLPEGGISLKVSDSAVSFFRK